jgi:hypothetical protein
VGGDPGGDGGAGGLVDRGWHAVHDGLEYSGPGTGVGALDARLAWSLGSVPSTHDLAGSWAAMLEPFRAVFRRRGTFTMFTMLATGTVAQNGRRSVVGMLAGARMAGVVSFHVACRFFSAAVWDVDRLG